MMNTVDVSTDQKLAALSKGKKELLKLLLERQARRASGVNRYARARDERVPASWAQQRIWFVSQLDEGGYAPFHLTWSARLEGPLNVRALTDALNAIVRRHEALRSGFRVSGGEVMQEITPDAPFHLKIIELAGQEPAEREAHIRRQQAEEAQEPFDLTAPGLIRGRLWRLRPGEHVLLITVHHLVSDGWSLGVLARELSSLYAAYSDGLSDPLPPLRVQYLDYARWQREAFHEALVEKQLAYWKGCLEGAPPELELPTDRPRPAARTYRGASLAVTLNAEVASELRALAKREGVTLFMVLCAAWAILLSRLSGQDEVVIGTPVANRCRPELEGLIGLFVNTIALRICATRSLPVRDLLRQAKSVTLDACANQDAPFEKVVEALQPRRSLGRSPLFQVMLSLQNVPDSEPTLPGLKVRREDPPATTTMFDLMLSLQERGDQIIGQVGFSTDLFDADTIARWMRCFATLLREMSAHIGEPIGGLSILPAEERHQVVDVFNATQVPFPREKRVHELFEDQVKRSPNAIALICRSHELTYAGLDERADQLARYLSSKEVGPDTLVGLYMDRSIDLVVALLGILKAGGAYVPLDPAFPAERLQHMLGSANPRLVLTKERLRSGLSKLVCPVLALDSEWSEITACAGERSRMGHRSSCSRDLAYVIFTSGSTGVPKGVMVEHSGVVNFLTSMQHVPGITATDCVLAITTISFDIAALEIYLPLISGARVILATGEEAADARLLIPMLEKFNVSVLQATPARWQLLLNAGWSGRPNLKALCGGEALTCDLADRLAPRVASLWNLYGPTETTIWSCCLQVPAHTDQRPTVESIGRPIANTQIYILDAAGCPVPIGVAGEIYIGGAGVARGYWQQPDITEERFRPDPCRDDPCSRIYKSGDLGRWRADGTIEYLGRNDHQVKIRGFRIELGDIESQLANHLRVSSAVVVAREDVPGDKHLVAYVTPREVDVQALRVRLQSALPAYMIPSAFVALESLPLTPNGKIDRLALPAPDPGSQPARPFESPAGEVEQKLAEIWRELLNVQASRHHNFFELGGHSLHGMKMVMKIAELFSVQLPIAAVFRHPTIQQLAEAIELASTKDIPGPVGEVQMEEGVI